MRGEDLSVLSEHNCRANSTIRSMAEGKLKKENYANKEMGLVLTQALEAFRLSPD